MCADSIIRVYVAVTVWLSEGLLFGSHWRDGHLHLQHDVATSALLHRAKWPCLTVGFSGGIVRNRGQQLWDLEGNSSTAAVAYAVPVLLMLTPFPLLLLLLQV